MEISEFIRNAIKLKYKSMHTKTSKTKLKIEYRVDLNI